MTDSAIARNKQTVIERLEQMIAEVKADKWGQIAICVVSPDMLEGVSFVTGSANGVACFVQQLAGWINCQCGNLCDVQLLKDGLKALTDSYLSGTIGQHVRLPTPPGMPTPKEGKPN